MFLGTPVAYSLCRWTFCYYDDENIYFKFSFTKKSETFLQCITQCSATVHARLTKATLKKILNSKKIDKFHEYYQLSKTFRLGGTRITHLITGR